MRGAEAMDEYVAIAPAGGLRHREYWLLEEMAKLKRMPPEKDGSPRQIIAVLGAGSGIGKRSPTA